MDPSLLNNTDRIYELRKIIKNKEIIRQFYLRNYLEYQECLKQCPTDGLAIELGSGPGFIKEVIPDIITTDVLPYDGVDIVVDAMDMPFPDKSLCAIFMQNVFHHIPDVEKFFHEATRCLKQEGRILIVDQHNCLFSRFIQQHFHHEPFLPYEKEWQFPSSGPLSSANGALAWNVFIRDRKTFENKFGASLQIESYRPHTLLGYWLGGGIRPWSLPFAHFFTDAITMIDSHLSLYLRNQGSFVSIRIKKK